MCLWVDMTALNKRMQQSKGGAMAGCLGHEMHAVQAASWLVVSVKF